MRTTLHAVQTADRGDLAALGDAAREARAAAMQRRRLLSQGKAAINARGGAPAFVVHRGGAR